MFAAHVDATRARAAMRGIMAALPGAQRWALDATARQAARTAQRTTQFKDRTGLLRSRIQAQPATARSARVVANTRYAKFVENGTPAHTIRGRNGGLLRFTVNGHTIYRRSVQHPGTRPRPFMADTARSMAPVLGDYLAQATSQALAMGAR